MLKKKISLTGDSPNQDGGGKDYEITDTGNTNMKVVVRIRPENDMEIRSNCETVVKALDNHVLVFDPKEDNLPQFDNADVVRKRRPFLSRKRKDLRFAFDRVFDETTTQREVFENTTKTIIEGLLDGINCSVFAYGATGAGKTHTMLGTSDKPGVMFLTTMELYRCIEQLKHEKTCDIAVTYLEVYNETIRDLLVPSGPLAMREDSQKGLVVAGLSQHQPTSAEELLQMLEKGNMNRTQHPTDANATSSRSHAVFQVYVNQKSRTAGLSTEVTQGKMSLIDLAGSERATVTTNKGARLREGANINKSLLALGNCINALAANKVSPHQRLVCLYSSR
jgi:kinesin family protein 18/19